MPLSPHPPRRRRDDRRDRLPRGAARARLRPAGERSRFEPGGSAANQAAWLAAFGVAVDFVARVGAADLEAEAARLRAGRRHAASRRRPASGRPAGSSRSSTRAASAASSPTGAPTRRFRRRHSRRVDRGRVAHPPLRLFLLRPLPARRGARRHAPRRRDAGQRRSRLGGIPARGGRGKLSRLDARRGDALPQRGRGGGACRNATIRRPNVARLAAHYPLVVVKRGAAGCLAAEGAAALAARGAEDRRRSTHRRRRRLRRRLSRRAPSGAEIETALERAVAAGSAAVRQVGGGRSSLRLMEAVRPTDILASPRPIPIFARDSAGEHKTCGFVVPIPR